MTNIEITKVLFLFLLQTYQLGALAQAVKTNVNLTSLTNVKFYVACVLCDIILAV